MNEYTMTNDIVDACCKRIITFRYESEKEEQFILYIVKRGNEGTERGGGYISFSTLLDLDFDLAFDMVSRFPFLFFLLR